MTKLRLLAATLTFTLLAAVPLVAGAQAAPRVYDIDALRWIAAAAPGVEFAMVDGNPQGDGRYVVAMRYKAGTMTPAHTHPEEMTLVVARGQFIAAAGDRAETAGQKTLNAGSVAVFPKGSHHFEGAVTDAIVVISGVGPMRIDLLDPHIKSSTPPQSATPR